MLRDIYTDNGFFSTASGRKKYHDIIERYTDEESDITTTTTTMTTTTTTTTTQAPASGKSQIMIGSYSFNIVAVGFTMMLYIFG